MFNPEKYHKKTKPKEIVFFDKFGEKDIPIEEFIKMVLSGKA